MTTNINPSEFEPTAEMKKRWPEISAATRVHPTIFSIIYITKLADTSPHLKYGQTKMSLLLSQVLVQSAAS